MNKTLKALIAKREGIQAKAQAIVDGAATDNRDELSEEEFDEFEGFTAELAELDSKIARQKAVADFQSKPKARQVAPSANLDVDTIPAGAPAAGVAAPAVASVRELVDPKRGYANTAEFFHDVMRASITRKPSARLLPLAAVGSDEQNTVNDDDGGYLVPEGFLPRLLEVTPEVDFLAPLVQRIPMGNPTVKIPARLDKDHTTSVSGGLIVARRAEMTAVAANRMKFEEIQLNANSLSGLAYSTDELIQDSAISIAAILARGFSQEWASKLLEERIRGTGTGEFLGVLNSAATIVQAKDAGQAADTITYTNLINMRTKCWGYNNAVWIFTQEAIPQLATLEDGAGNRIWQAGVQGIPGVVADIPDRLLGRPVFYSEHASVLGDEGDVILGNWMEYLQGDLTGIETAESIHVRFEYHERAFRFNQRNDGKPWWTAQLTPKNATAGFKMSPFVTLAERA